MTFDCRYPLLVKDCSRIMHGGMGSISKDLIIHQNKNLILPSILTKCNHPHIWLIWVPHPHPLQTDKLWNRSRTNLMTNLIIFCLRIYLCFFFNQIQIQIVHTAITCNFKLFICLIFQYYIEFVCRFWFSYPWHHIKVWILVW